MKKFFSVLVLLVTTISGDLAIAGEQTAKNITNITPLNWWFTAPLGSLLALAFAFLFYRMMMKTSPGNERMIEIASYVREGATAYLTRQYKTVVVVFILLAIVFTVLAMLGLQDPFLPLAFLLGGFFSGLSGYIGMRTATNAASRTAQAATQSLNKGLQIAFRSGAVMGLVVVGLGLLFVCICYVLLDKLVFTPSHMQTGFSIFGVTVVPQGCTPEQKMILLTTLMLGFGMGASTQALFARVGGGIYTKAADVGADLVGKVEAGIPEDDPSNPAVIADNVGDNVGDVAGMGADLFESYVGSLLSTCVLGAAAGGNNIDTMTRYVVAPMIVAGIGNVLSIVGILIVRSGEEATQANLLRALLTGTLGSSILMVLALLGMVWLGWIPLGVWGAATAGLIGGIIIGKVTEYYTSDAYKPTREISAQALTGPATVIIAGLSTGMLSAGIPVMTVSIVILSAFGFAGGFSNVMMGLYGVGFAAVGMLSTLGVTLASDCYGPIADNAGGNAEMSHLPPYVRERTDALDALGNTTAATGKGFAIGSAALTALALIVAFLEAAKGWVARYAEIAPDKIFYIGKTAVGSDVISKTTSEFARLYGIHLVNPMVLAGLFIGGAVPFVFCAFTMRSVGRAAGSIVEEVRRQFREIPGILSGQGKPDYGRCVAISTSAAQREMILPSLLAIIIPFVVGLFLGVGGVIGLLTGALVSGFALACMLNNGGAAWDNAKKYIEKGNYGGKKLPDGSKNPVHAAAVVGDTVGDPCKDTSGPSLNILIKLMSIVSVVFAPLIIKLSPIIQRWIGLSTN